MPLSPFGAALQQNALHPQPRPFKSFVGAWQDATTEDTDAPIQTAADATARLLLDLGVLLFQEQCKAWQRTGKAWTSEAKVEGAIRYFLKGVRLGQRALFDGICAYGGHLLYGNLGETGVSNKRNGPPVDICGEKVAGAAADDAQPPFLLRW